MNAYKKAKKNKDHKNFFKAGKIVGKVVLAAATIGTAGAGLM